MLNIVLQGIIEDKRSAEPNLNSTSLNEFVSNFALEIRTNHHVNINHIIQGGIKYRSYSR